MINEALLLPISNTKVKTVVFQLGGGKALGPDGFSSLFYAELGYCWSVIM